MPRIMVVDDDDDIRTDLVEALQRAGYEVFSAADARTALLRMRENPPDLLLTDVLMPHTDGWALIRACRADAQLANIPALVMSGSAGMRDLAKRAGAQGFLLKPFSRTTTLEAVVNALAHVPAD
jgi:CheY-like chemotaxis protein